VLRLETAWLTAVNPRLKSCCLHVIFTKKSFQDALGLSRREE
jgi:hypothetical protein